MNNRRVKGKLIPSGIDTENFTENDWDNTYGLGLIQIDDELYKLEWDGSVDYQVIPDNYQWSFSHNLDGSIEFDMYRHYNGIHWVRLIEQELTKG